MTGSIRIRVAALASVSLVALAASGGAEAAAHSYVPFVTDFPHGAAPVGRYQPFVSDFGTAPRPAEASFTLRATEPQAVEASPGRAWDDVAFGGGLGIAFALLVAAAALAVRGVRPRGGRGHGVPVEPQAAPRP